MVKYILDDTPKMGGPAASRTPFLIKHYGVIYYILNVFVVLVAAACFWNPRSGWQAHHVEYDNKVPLVLGILCGAPIFVDILLTIPIHILTHRKK